jgi:hypothetical protein
LSAGAGAGIAIGVLVLVLAAIGGLIFLLRIRRRRLRARTRAGLAVLEDKPQLDDTSIVPQNGRNEVPTTPFEVRQELEGSPIWWETPNRPAAAAAELRAGPYSNRHELESRAAQRAETAQLNATRWSIVNHSNQHYQYKPSVRKQHNRTVQGGQLYTVPTSEGTCNVGTIAPLIQKTIHSKTGEEIEFEAG